MKEKPFEPPRLKERQSILNERRGLKMARSAHAYVRGNTTKFYEWLESLKSGTLPDGPPVWICGDCHVGNLGPVANAKGQVEIQIRDLDQTVIGNPAHDLIRLGLSLATAARGSDLPGVTTARMMEQMIEGYEAAFADIGEPTEDFDQPPRAIRIVLKRSLARSWKHLARERIDDLQPTIPLGERFWPLAKKERVEIARLFETEAVRRLVTALRTRDDDAKVAVLDAAYWMKGCSSLGRLRYAVLAGVGGRAKGAETCLIDIKEATQAVAPRYAGVTMPRDNAERVVTGARALAPHLGQRMLAARFLDRAVFLRELLPQDLKLEIEQLSRPEAMSVARFLAHVVGKAHARQMDDSTRRHWRDELGRNHSQTLDAPSWLWTSIVALVVSHEAAYLDHCRRYAMSAEAA
jgi:uncharacterized protein (DUF2252 family)